MMPGILEGLAPLNPALSIAGSLTSIAALGMAIFAIQRAFAHSARMKREHAKNAVILRRTLDGCRATISRILKMADGEQYFRALGALSSTLNDTLARYETCVREEARQSISDMSLLLLDAATNGHAESIRLLESAHAMVEMLLDNIGAPKSGL